MKRFLSIVILLVCAASARAQNTTVTGRITDPSGNPYANCSISGNYVDAPAGPSVTRAATINGSPLQFRTSSTSCDSNGNFSLFLYDTAVINYGASTGGGTYQFTVSQTQTTPLPGQPTNPRFTYTAPVCPTAGCITGASINITAALQAVSIALPVVPQPASLTANNTFTGINTFGIVNNILYVGGTIGTTLWGSSDIATQIQTAYNSTSCPIPGCRIRVLPGSYSTANVVVLGTAGKRVILEGDGIGVSVLNYTGSATFITFNNTLSTDKFQGWGSGIRDLDILGPGGPIGAGGNAGTGVLYGGTNFQLGFVLDKVRVAGFTTNLQRSSDSTTWGLFVQDSVFISCGNTTKNVLIQNATENNTFSHNLFTGFCTAVANPGDVTVKGNADIKFIANSFDSSALVVGDVSGGQYGSVLNHYEMGPGITNATADVPVTVNGGQFVSSLDSFYYDPSANGTGPPAEFISCTAGNLDISHSIFVHSFVTIASFINASGTCVPNYEASTVDPASNGFSTALTDTSSSTIFYNRFANGSISISGGVTTAGKFCASTSAACATGSTAGDGSFARSTTTGTTYWGSDGNMFLSRTAVASATFNFAGTMHNNGNNYVWGDGTNPWLQFWSQQFVMPESPGGGPASAANTGVLYADSGHFLKASENGGNNHIVPLTEYGSCAMVAGTTCTFSAAKAFAVTPFSQVSIDQASAPPATAISAKCSISGTTVTITAGASNSLTWDCLLIGNPN